MIYFINLFIPEIILLCLACFVLLFTLFLKESDKHFIFYIIQLSLIFILFFLFFFSTVTSSSNFFNFSFNTDMYSNLLKIIIIFFLLFIFIYTKFFVKVNGIKIGEYYALSLFSALGMLLLVSSNNLLMFYLSIELISIPLYVLIAMIDTYETSSESSIKYFVLGSLASSILLFGISLVYGSTGVINFNDVQNLLTSSNSSGVFSSALLQCGYFLIICGLLFKLGVAPFHMWVPDIYKGSSIFITLFISSVPKIAIFGIFYKFIFFIFSSYYSKIIVILAIFALLSLFIGNVFALVQTNIKRMFAYSSITNVGFIILGLLCFEQSSTVVFFYLFVYIFTALGSFAFLLFLAKSTTIELENLDSFKGFGLREPALSFILLIFLLSTAGIPPLLGFYSKLLILNSILSEGFLAIAIFSVLLTVVGLFFYLRVIKLMFFDFPENISYFDDSKIGIRYDNKSSFFLLSCSSFLLLFFGIYPYPLIKFCSLFVL